MFRYNDYEEDKKKSRNKGKKNTESDIYIDYTDYILNADESEMNDAYNDNPDLVNNILKEDSIDKDLEYDNMIGNIYSEIKVYMDNNMINNHLECEDILFFIEDKIPLSSRK